MVFRIHRKGSVAAAIRAGVIAEALAAVRKVECAETDRHQAVHAVRKHAKRIRAALRLVRPHFGRFDGANARVRDAARALAGVRDAQSVLESFERLERAYGFRLGERECARTRAALIARRDARAWSTDEIHDRLAAFAQAMRAVAADAESWRFDAKGRGLVQDGLVDAYRKAVDAMHLAYDADQATAFHEWRKWTKIHLHHLQLLRKMRPAWWSRRIRKIDALAERLGEDHDLWMLRQLMGSEEPLELSDDTRHSVARWSDLMCEVIRDEAQPNGRALFRASPRRFGARFAADWQAWRRG